MKAIISTKYGPASVLQIVERENPVPKIDEVLINIYATSVTNSDIFIRSSNIPLLVQIPMRLMIGIRKPRNEILGEVFAGKIAQIGSNITRFQVGDLVFGFTGLSLGAYADFKCMREKDSKRGCIAKMPQNISFEEATFAAYGGLLALQALEPTQIQPQQKVLIYGASGTTGTFAVQYAKHLQADVTAVCSAKHADLVSSLGADKFLDYTDKNSIAKLETYDVILDAVGHNKTSGLKTACKRALSKNGKYVSIDDGALLLDSNRMQRIKELVEVDAVKPVTDRIFPFEQIVAAHEYVELGHKAGNVAITVNRDS